MSGLLEYSGLATKLKAMGAGLLSTDEYNSIMNMNSLSEAIGFLCGHDIYREVFSGETIESLSRMRIEQLLQDTIYLDYEKVYHFASMKQKKFLQTYFIKYEISFIKMCLRLCCGHSGMEISPYGYTGMFAGHMSFDVNSLINSSSIDELLVNLVGTDYYKVLGTLRGRDNITMYDYEILLDIYYYRCLWKNLNSILARDELKSIRNIYGTQIDLLNMQWIYRARRYYKLTEADVYALIIPIHYKLKKEDIRNFVKAADESELKNLFIHSRYGKYYQEDDDRWLEHAYAYAMESLHKKGIKKHPYSAWCIDYYFYRKELETQKLVRLTECLRYGKSAEDMKRLVFDV